MVARRARVPSAFRVVFFLRVMRKSAKKPTPGRRGEASLLYSLHLFDHQCTQSEVHDGHGKQRCVTDMVGEIT
jgi:hypothetical protein